MDVVRDPDAPTPPPGQDQLPSSDGEPMETSKHRDQMNLLIYSLDDAWRERRDYYVGGNMFVYFSELQTRRNDFRGPDVFVVLDTQRERSRKSWVAWEEGGRLPDVVVELLSESTQQTDRGDKFRIYERIWRTGHYVLFDPLTGLLEGYVLSGSRYEPIVPDARGDLPIVSTGLLLGVRTATFRHETGPWLRWIDREGVPLPWPEERAESEKERAESERERAESERERAEQENQRAEQEKARADTAERRLAELEASLRR